jgi:hypothetical protein
VTSVIFFKNQKDLSSTHLHPLPILSPLTPSLSSLPFPTFPPRRTFLRYVFKQEGDWGVFLRTLDMVDLLPSCGGRQASTDGAAVLDKFTQPWDPASE